MRRSKIVKLRQFSQYFAVFSGRLNYVSSGKTSPTIVDPYVTTPAWSQQKAYASGTCMAYQWYKLLASFFFEDQQTHPVKFRRDLSLGKNIVKLDFCDKYIPYNSNQKKIAKKF